MVPAIACYGATIHAVKKKHRLKQYRFVHHIEGRSEPYLRNINLDTYYIFDAEEPPLSQSSHTFITDFFFLKSDMKKVQEKCV